MDTIPITKQIQEFQDVNNKIEYNDNSTNNMITLNIKSNTNAHKKGAENNPNFVKKNQESHEYTNINQNKADLTNQSGEDILVILENKEKDDNNNNNNNDNDLMEYQIREKDLKENLIENELVKEGLENMETDRPLGHDNGIEAENKDKDITEKLEVQPTEDTEPPVKTCKLTMLVINLSIGFYYFGYEVGVFNPVQENIAFDLGWTPEDKKINLSLISSLLTIGIIFGSFATGKISNAIGRKWCYIILDAISLVGIAIKMIANTYSMMIGRLICGIGVGGFITLVPLVVNEYTPIKYQGIASACYNITFNIGLIMAFALGTNTQPVDKLDLVWWRIMYAIPSIFLILNMVLLLAVYKIDSPPYLLSINEREQCIEAYKEMYENEEDIMKMLAVLEDEIKKKESQEQVTFKDLFCTDNYKRQLFMGIWLALGMQITALNVFNNYSTLIFLRSLSQEDATFFTTMLSVANFIGAISSIFIYGRVGNKKVLIASFVTIFICLFVFSLCEANGYPDPEKYFVILEYYVLGAGIYVIFKCLPELLTDIGQSFCLFLYGILSFTIVFTFPSMMESSLNLQWSIMLYAGLNLVWLIVIIIFYKETNGLTLTQVNELYSTWLGTSEPKLEGKIIMELEPVQPIATLETASSPVRQRREIIIE